MVFKDPWIILIAPIIIGFILFLKRKNKPASFRFPSNDLFVLEKISWKLKFINIPQILRLIVLCLFFFALAGPRSVLQETIHESEGIDIVLAIDISGSMAAEDFKINGNRVNRLEIVKKVVREFIDLRTNDRIGLVSFASLAYTVCPLTTDYSWLEKNLDRLELGLIQDGTAVGSAIATSLNRLKQSDAKSKIVILLTDGMNNAGKIDPIAAAKAAKALSIKIYTIGAGTKGYVPFPAQDFFGRKVYQNVLIDIDEKMLKEVANISGGKYYRATDTESLRNIYKEIDALEKTKIEELGFVQYEELFSKYLLIALFLLLLEIILSNTIFLRIP